MTSLLNIPYGRKELVYASKWEALFANEQEVKEIIEQLKEKGIMRSNVGYTINGFRGKYRSIICPKVFYHLYRIWI
jgi:hypothetical protein